MSKGRLKFVERSRKETGKYYTIEKDTSLIELGIISYDVRWKSWVFRAFSHMFIFDSDCLKEITKFLDELHMKG